MFELVTTQCTSVPRRVGLPLMLSAVVQAAVIAVLAIAAVNATETPTPAKEEPTVLTFVAPAPESPAPAPPPPAAASKPKPTPTLEKIPPIEVQRLAPIEPPDTDLAALDDESLDFGVPEGVQGGVPGGVVGGVIGGLPEPLPPPPTPKAPIRVGGQIKTPELVHRVEPQYPSLAVAAHLEGTVILEATVDRAGAVTAVKVLRSAGSSLLDREAQEAVRQWRYHPLRLNGVDEPFVLTVTLSFHLDGAS